MTSVTIDPAALDAVFAAFDRSDRPGMAVGVAVRGLPVYRRGFGLATVELPVVLTPSIRIRIGSVTKHFCCLAIMLLAEAGKLSPGDSVRRHIPELKGWADDVTLAHLMSHTGGARCSLELFATAGNIMSRPLPRGEQLKVMLGFDSANFAPGADWSYSNGGYVLLTEVIRRVGDQPFEQFLRRRILDPVGMHDTLARPLDTDLLPNSATLHVANPDGGFDRGIFGPEIGGEGNMVSTVDDMLRWMAHMDNPVVGSAATWRAMTTAVPLTDGRSSDYGYGLVIGNYRGLRTIQHSGTVVGGACQMIKLPDHGLDIIIIANAAGLNPTGLAEQVIDACMTDLPPGAEPADRPFATGDFYAPELGRYLRLAEKDGKPGIEYSPIVLPLTMRADGTAWYQTNLSSGTAISDLGDAIAVTEFERERILPRARPVVPGELDELAGCYRSRETPLEAVVAGGEAASITLSGLAGDVAFRLEARAPGLWMMLSKATGMVSAMIERDGSDLLLSSLRIHRLRLVRVQGRDGVGAIEGLVEGG